jgi:hypothetical protein
MNQRNDVLLSLYYWPCTTAKVTSITGACPKVLHDLRRVWLIKSTAMPKYRGRYNVRENTVAGYTIAESDIQKLSVFNRLRLFIKYLWL